MDVLKAPGVPSFAPRRRNDHEAHSARNRRMWVKQLVAAAITATLLAAALAVCLALHSVG
jgi:negative regulator of sigma E activity